MLQYFVELLNSFCYYIFDHFILYPLLQTAHRNFDLRFLNLGYLPIDGTNTFKIDEEKCSSFEEFLPHIYLYERTLSLCPLYPKFDAMNVLEVGCGFGGGLWSVKTFHPEVESIIGVDFIATENIDVRIIQGDAHDLPFQDNQFDIVINVESSHLYANNQIFLNECSRVLRRSGYLCWADIRFHDEVPEIMHQASNSEFEIIELLDITNYVLKGIQTTSKRYDNLLNKASYSIRLFSHAIRTTYCAPGTETYERLQRREKLYLCACWINNKSVRKTDLL